MYADEEVVDDVLGFYLNGEFFAYSQKNLTRFLLNSEKMVDMLERQLNEARNAS